MVAPDANATVVNSGPMAVGCTADEMRDAISSFYTEYFGVTPVVTKSFEDSAGVAVLEDNFDPTTHIILYRIQVMTAIGTCTQ